MFSPLHLRCITPRSPHAALHALSLFSLLRTTVSSAPSKKMHPRFAPFSLLSTTVSFFFFYDAPAVLVSNRTKEDDDAIHRRLYIFDVKKKMQRTKDGTRCIVKKKMNVVSWSEMVVMHMHLCSLHRDEQRTKVHVHNHHFTYARRTSKAYRRFAFSVHCSSPV